ncbi:MAG: polymer-forming cytoskeletal protein [Alphaproteobacteria bacterium]
MFRKRDTDPMDSENGAGETVEAEDDALPEPEQASELELEPEPELELINEPDDVVTAPDHPMSHSDLPESKPLSTATKPAAASLSSAASSDAPANKRLIVGQGIRLSGEINSCDRLVVEGEVEVTLNDTLALEIASSGRFTGGCEVEEADISGIYEGDLTVRNTLFVRGTGRITGTIRYGQLELERGGQIAGNISVLGNESAGDSSKLRPKSPLFGNSAS